MSVRYQKLDKVFFSVELESITIKLLLVLDVLLRVYLMITLEFGSSAAILSKWVTHRHNHIR